MVFKEVVPCSGTIERNNIKIEGMLLFLIIKYDELKAELIVREYVDHDTLQCL